MRKSFKLLAALAIFTAPLHASPLDDFLNDVEGQFDQSSKKQKFRIISEPLNLDYLEKLKKIEDLDTTQLKSNVGYGLLSYKNPKGHRVSNTSKTNPLALAISLGKTELVRKFLTAVPDINHVSLTAWGYRQPYGPAHMALDPQYPEASGNISLQDRLAIIDLLGEKNANFNDRVAPIGTASYFNPPLAAGTPSGHCESCTAIESRRARALLYGGDPKRTGSSFFGFKFDSNSRVMNLTLDYYIEQLKTGSKLQPTAEVFARLKETAAQRGINLDDFKKTVERKHHLQAQIQSGESQISQLKTLTTKKSHTQVRHLLQIQAESHEEMTQLDHSISQVGKKK